MYSLSNGMIANDLEGVYGHFCFLKLFLIPITCYIPVYRYSSSLLLLAYKL